MRQRLLSFLKVRERPDPPPGSGNLQTFRASERYLYLSAFLWLPKQISALLGLLMALAFFGTFELPFLDVGISFGLLEVLEKIDIDLWGWHTNPLRIVTFFEALAIVTFAGQFVFSGVFLKLSWELRWYMVGDRSLRIREGLWSLREQTVTIANIQNMTLRQGPLQRLFGISDLEIRTAGGGAIGNPAESGKIEGPSLHIARLKGLRDAESLRDMIRARLILQKGSGLGDGDDDSGTALREGPAEVQPAEVRPAEVRPAEVRPAEVGPAEAPEMAEAAEALLGEIRALRRQMTTES